MTDRVPSTVMHPQTVLVTGAAGYIGSHTCVELLTAGHDVVGVDNFANSSPVAVDRIREIAGRDLAFHEADLRDEDAVGALFDRHRIDSVIHFAGLKAVGESVAEPLRYYDNNVAAAVTLFRVMADADVTRLVFSSSATVYGEPDEVPIREDAPLRALNPYGRTKLMIEDILRDVGAADERWRVALLRYFNPVGAHASGRLGEDPRDIPNNLMPLVMRAALGTMALRVFCDDYPTRDGTCIRDYIHVVDLADAHVRALDLLAAGPCGVVPINLGTGNGVTVLEIIAAASAAVGHEIPFERTGRRPGDAAAVWAEPARAAELLGWRAERTIEDMCADHWRFQQAHPAGYA
jgi:UDP-glucose 4-epimerase